MFTLPNGTNVGFGQTFTIEGEKFSPTWLRYATNADLVSKGITRFEPPPQTATPSKPKSTRWPTRLLAPRGSNMIGRSILTRRCNCD